MTISIFALMNAAGSDHAKDALVVYLLPNLPEYMPIKPLIEAMEENRSS